MIVDSSALGTANGVSVSLINLLLTVVPLVLGKVLYNEAGPGHMHYGYIYEQGVLLGIILLGCIVSMALVLDDRYNRGCNLERDPKDKRAKRERKEIASHNPRLSKE